MKRTLLIAAAVFLQASAHAQVQLQTGVPPTLEVQRLAPQLVVFAGGDVNFANLVNGLAFGVPVTLTTTLQTGVTEVVTFTPVGTMSPLVIAQLLEAARQSLIARGVAAPTAQQLGITLAGGNLATATGTATMNPLITTVATPGTTTASATPSLLPSGALRNTSDSPLPRGISDTPPTFTNSQLSPAAPLGTSASSTAPLGAAGAGATTAPPTTGTAAGVGGGIRPAR